MFEELTKADMIEVEGGCSIAELAIQIIDIILKSFGFGGNSQNSGPKYPINLEK